jgi:NADH-quinone oxidoreductase subunit A
MNPYVPLLFLLAIGGGFAVFSVFAASIAGPKRYNRAKVDAYECGIQPTPQAAGGGRVPIKYYLTAIRCSSTRSRWPSTSWGCSRSSRWCCSS